MHSALAFMIEMMTTFPPTLFTNIHIHTCMQKAPIVTRQKSSSSSAESRNRPSIAESLVVSKPHLLIYLLYLPIYLSIQSICLSIYLCVHLIYLPNLPNLSTYQPCINSQELDLDVLHGSPRSFQDLIEVSNLLTYLPTYLPT